jgi:hypothetical protein
VHEQAQFAWVVNEWLSAQRSRAQNPDLVSQVEAAMAAPAGKSRRRTKVAD